MIPGSKKRISVSNSRVHDRLNSKPPTPRSKTLQLRNLCLPVAIVLLALAFSCARKPNNGEQNRSTIKIGYFGDLTGPTFNFGRSAYNGVLMAASEINQLGGINNRQIDVVK